MCCLPPTCSTEIPYVVGSVGPQMFRWLLTMEQAGTVWQCFLKCKRDVRDVPLEVGRSHM